MKETNSKRTIKERCERSCGNIGKMIALRALFRYFIMRKKIPAQRVKNYGHKELIRWVYYRTVDSNTIHILWVYK